MIGSLTFLAAQQGAGMTSLLMMAAIFAVFYILLILPQQRRQKKWQHMLGELKSGDRVTTTGGIIGIILTIRQPSESDAGSITIRVAPDNLKLEIARSAIASVTVDDSAKKS